MPLKIPAYNGYGDEKDSLGYVFRLLPQPPKKDFFKFVDMDQKILRFYGRLNVMIL